MDMTALKDERDKLFAELCKYDPAAKEYGDILEHYNRLNTIISNEEQKDVEAEDKERELALKREKIRSDSETERQSISQKEKDSKRGLVKTIITGVLGLFGIIVTIFAEQTRIITSKAWSMATARLPKN